MDRSAIKNMNTDYFEFGLSKSCSDEAKKTLTVVVTRIDVSGTEGLTPRVRGEYMSQMARMAVNESARLSGLHEIRKFPKNTDGAPGQENGVWWGVSHKPEIVAGAVSSLPVGLDVEIIRNVSDRLTERIVSEKERLLFSIWEQDSFFRVWTAKEAVLKFCGHGLSGLSSCFIDSVQGPGCLLVKYGEKNYPVTSLVRETYIVSVVAFPQDVTFFYQPLSGQGLFLKSEC